MLNFNQIDKQAEQKIRMIRTDYPRPYKEMLLANLAKIAEEFGDLSETIFEITGATKEEELTFDQTSEIEEAISDLLVSVLILSKESGVDLPQTRSNRKEV